MVHNSAQCLTVLDLAQLSEPATPPDLSNYYANWWVWLNYAVYIKRVHAMGSKQIIQQANTEAIIYSSLLGR